MPYRDLAVFSQLVKHMETFGLGNIFQIDTTKTWCNKADCFNYLIRILCVQADSHCIYASKILEEQGFSLHYRHASFRADITKTKNSCPIAYYGDSICPVGVFIGQFDIFFYSFTWCSNTWGIPDGKVLDISYTAFQCCLHLTLIKRMKLHCILCRFFRFCNKFFFTKHFCCLLLGCCEILSSCFYYLTFTVFGAHMDLRSIYFSNSSSER